MTVSPRIQLRDTTFEQGKRLLAVTGLGSLTELITVMFSRYGHHLEATWEVMPSPGANITPPEPAPLSMGEEQEPPSLG